MVHKRYKSAAAESLRKETNAHCVNPSAFKIDLRSCTHHMHSKDENADFELSCNFLDDSSFSDNQMLSAFKHFSDADDESCSSDCTCKSAKMKSSRRVRPGRCDIACCNDRHIKAKHRYSSWFMMHVEKTAADDDFWLKDFRL